MKKVLCIILTVVMIFSSFAVIESSAHTDYLPGYYTDNPSIYIRGNGYIIYDSDGNRVYDFDVTSDQIKEMASAILPEFIKGYISGDFTEYYKVADEQFAKLYDRCSLDENANPKYGTNVNAEALAERERDMTVSRANENGTFQYGDYQFEHDWRLDPIENAALFNDYINAILKTTGKQKVNINIDCLGGVLVMAYLAEYGHDKVESISFESTVAFGSELVNDTFSGNIDVDSDALVRFLEDEFMDSQIPENYKDIYEFIETTVALAGDTGVLNGVTDAFMTCLYDKLYENLVPLLAMDSYGSWPSYWALVSAEDYASTRDFVFGEEGSEKYEKYRTFIEKLDRYDTDVRQRIPEILTSAKNDGVNLVIISKYGFQLPPVIESYDEQSDIWTSVKYSSLGATTAKIGTTLSDDYIAQKNAEGLGKYISPDKMIDASTCLLPDNTWFVKGCMHNQGSLDFGLLSWEAAQCKGTYSTANSSFSQFLVYDSATATVTTQTAENCDTETYSTDNETKTGFAGFWRRINDFFANIVKWLTSILSLISNRAFS